MKQEAKQYSVWRREREDEAGRERERERQDEAGRERERERQDEAGREREREKDRDNSGKETGMLQEGIHEAG